MKLKDTMKLVDELKDIHDGGDLDCWLYEATVNVLQAHEFKTRDCSTSDAYRTVYAWDIYVLPINHNDLPDDAHAFEIRQCLQDIREYYDEADTMARSKARHYYDTVCAVLDDLHIIFKAWKERGEELFGNNKQGRN